MNRNKFSLRWVVWFCLTASFLPAQEKSLDELLQLNVTDLLHLKVVSALKSPETVLKVPATVRVITAEQIRENGYFTLEDALADLPGFQFRNILGFNSYAFLRGVPGQNNKILLLVDGIQINELNSGGFYAGGQFNLSHVDRIEIVYGPASALYGTNAVSGVISIFTRDPKESPGGQANVTIGNLGSRLVDFRYGFYHKKSDIGFNLSAMVKQNQKADLGGKEGDFNWTEAMENFEDDIAVDARVRHKGFSAGFLLQDKDASYATAQLGLSEAGKIPVSDRDVNWHIRFLNLWASYVYDRGNDWSLRSTAYYRSTTVLDDTIPIIELPTAVSLGRQYRYYRPNRLVGDETQLRWTPYSRWRLSLGLVLETERLADGISTTESESAYLPPPIPSAPTLLHNRLISVYAQSQTSLAGYLDLFFGVRHDDSNYYGSVTTPQFGLVLNRGRLTAKILTMQAFRAPKPWDYTNGLGNPSLEPEKSRSLEASGGWSFSPHLRFDLSVYHNRLNNLLTRVNEADDWRWINTGSLTTDGCESGLEYRQGRIKSYFNYTYTRSLDDQNRQVSEIAPHGGNLGIAYSFHPRLQVGLRGQYLGERINPKIVPSTKSDRIDDAVILHTNLSFKLNRTVDLRLTVNNLTDTVYYHPSNLPPSRYRQPQRTFRLTIGYSF